MADTKASASVQEQDYEFFRAGIDGRRDGEQPTDKRFGGLLTFCKFLFTIFLVALLGGLLGAGGVAYMARQFKNKPKDMKISVYLIHTRMYAQMTVVGRFNQIDHQCCLPFSSLWIVTDWIFQGCFAAGCSVRCGNREKPSLVLLLVVIDYFI